MRFDPILAARGFAALGDPTRLQVFALVSRAPQSVSELAGQLPVSRPAVSQHLKVLAGAGLVRCDPEGTRNIYRPDGDGIASMQGFIDSLWDVGLARFKAQAEAVAAQRGAGPKAAPDPAPTAAPVPARDTAAAPPASHSPPRARRRGAARPRKDRP